MEYAETEFWRIFKSLGMMAGKLTGDAHFTRNEKERKKCADEKIFSFFIRNERV